MCHIVTGYWDIELHKQKNDFYKEIIKKGILKNIIIDNRTIFCDESSYDLIKKNSYDNDTIIIKNINDFYVNNFDIEKCKLHSIHVPSYKLGKIWLEKINLLYEIYNEDICQNKLNEWYVWMDICIPFLRTNKINEKWPNNIKIDMLNKNKINYSKSNNMDMDICKNYGHNFAGGCFIIHKNKLKEFRDIFYNYLKKYIIETNYNFFALSDQCVFTRIMVDNPDMFNVIETKNRTYCGVLIELK